VKEITIEEVPQQQTPKPVVQTIQGEHEAMKNYLQD
jgi:hypothetical protein